ncbi:hypothetical protein [Spectribacter hydrogenoxidans]|uniref:Uncharacterized protein n=1 Tax=Spectribacter hydrogenoxidans TaxID=3075608 RepID=A0ABU3C0H0_9GAMM|nr:hypothetical protein [Salinisphaera sp. W335]MDT0635052.1 hypothetical protein [Salinisphaera sp. W335]
MPAKAISPDDFIDKAPAWMTSDRGVGDTLSNARALLTVLQASQECEQGARLDDYEWGQFLIIETVRGLVSHAEVLAEKQQHPDRPQIVKGANHV